MPTQSTEEIKKLIMSELPALIKSEPELRDFVLKITREVYADKRETESRFDRMMDELRRDREASEKRWEAWGRKWEAAQKALEKKWEAQEKKWESWEKKWAEEQKAQEKKWAAQEEKWAAQEKKWEAWEKKYEENQQVIRDMLESIKKVDHRIDSTIGALGARWGMQAEDAFRDGLKAIVEDSFGVKVERYEDYDHQGVIFGRPDQVELDLIIKDGILIICEIKSSMSKSDMYVFWRKKEFYEEKHGIEATRVMVISPMIDPRAKVVAEKLGIETYGYAGDAKI